MVNKVRTIDFLPEVFQTETNRQFLAGSLDVITSQPDFRRVQGFIGEKYGYSVEPNDRYVVEPTKERRDYQMDPGVIFLKPDTQTAVDFINYPGMLAALRGEGGITNNHDRLWNNQFYSWDPFIDQDKAVNYGQYYWIPDGPDSLPVTYNTVYLSADYTVEDSDNGYEFSGIPGTNPAFSLLRSGTYTFEIPAGSPEFWIQTVPGVTATTAQRTIPGVTGNGSTSGTITFVVPPTGTLALTKLYYQAGDDPNSVGIIQLIENNTSNYIDVDEIIGRKTYTSPNGVKFTNGLKIQFEGNVYPSSYQGQEYYVDGVGTSIVLLAVNNYIVPELSGGAIYNAWDIDPWDVLSYDIQLDIPTNPDYLTISRNSRDLNAWTRSNRWFHQDVINEVTKFLGQVTVTPNNTVTRAKRPILEFRGNLELYNSGLYWAGQIDLFDTLTPDAFSTIEGQLLTSIPPVDGVALYPGAKVVFAADTNPIVRNTVYTVNVVPLGPGGSGIVSLTPATGYTITDNTQVTVGGGLSLIGTTWRWSAATGIWLQCQKKTQVNQAPLFQIYDSDGVSLGDSSKYQATNFTGCKLFSYTPGSGPNDPVLGFPITYSNVALLGDIQFTVNLNSDTFNYNTDGIPVIQNVNIGFVHWWFEPISYEQLTGYVPAAGESFQYQVFEFPITTTYTYSSANTTVSIILGGTGYAAGDKVKIPGANLGGTTPENDLFLVVSTVGPGGVITGFDTTKISGNSAATEVEISEGFVEQVSSYGTSAVVTVVVDGAGYTNFTCDVPVKQNTQWNNIVVYSNDNIIDKITYTYTVNLQDLTTTVSVPTVIGTKTTVLLYSDYVSKTAYYQTPINLENNPFNANITEVAVGDLRNQYRTIFSNAPGVEGELFGNNNIHDLGNLNKYGTSIIQSSSTLVLPGVFLRRQEVNPFRAIQYNSEQYSIYKALLTDLAAAKDYSVYQTPSDILDDIIYTITTSKRDTTAFFWSDMLYSGNPYLVNNYSFGAPTLTATFNLSPEIWSPTLYTAANYNSVAVYLIRTAGTISTATQLLRGIDYTISTTLPQVILNYSILAGDTIVVKQYNQTYGSYCPSTPSKLGLYPIFIPQVVLNTTYTTPTWFILGHDGSYTKLYGTYDPATGVFDDFRDSVIFEFEKRVYNNYKVDSQPPLNYTDVVPGQWRTTEWSQEEVLQIYTTTFLNWVGANRIDYKTNVYNSVNKFTYNYNQTTNSLSGSAFLQGYWRGIYRWLYDTDNPAYAPWEMLGLVDKPSWWDSHYGPAPYTNGNTYMWGDIADGIVWNNGSPYVVEDRIRPGLLDALPVDSTGALVSPFYVAMGAYSSLTFNRDWVVGDGAPAESSYLKSSTWPFDLMRLLALTKPAKFFNLFADMDLYKWDPSFDQYLYNGRYHLDPRYLQIYGNGTAKHSYVNWVVDYINQSGANGTEVVTTLLRNLDVRLTYRVAGFTAKNYLKFLVEKATPNSKNTSLLIPDESYAVLLYNNPPEEEIIFSSVIVQIVNGGYIVYGNSKNAQYFTTAVPQPGLYTNITAGQASVQVSRNYYPGKFATIPYGTKFYTAQGVCEFLVNYGRYLSDLGIKFTYVSDGVEQNWQRSAQEFLAWAQQDWEVGSVLSLNPSAKNLLVDRPGLVVQPLQLHGSNFILNQNLLPVQQQNAAVKRYGNQFEVDILSNGDAMALANLNLYSIEHSIVFDNTTVFGDVIYNLVTGLRQPRLLLQGYKTGEWNGWVDASGFILNNTDIQSWIENKKYPKNSIVAYKSKYWVAVKLIEPKSEFSLEDWLETDYDTVRSMLLPNPSTVAYEAQYYYDVNRANLENDADLLSFSLIGFRPRDYMSAADLSDITQVNVFKNIIKYKGTRVLTEAFKGAQFDQGSIDYDINENWAIKEASFGSVQNRNYVEVRLDQALLKGNPTLLGFTSPGVTAGDVQQVVPITSIVNYERPPSTANFLPSDTTSYVVERGLPPAGYVNLNDSRWQAYFFGALNSTSEPINNIGVGDVVWIASHRNSWGVYTATGVGTQVVSAENNLNSTVTVTYSTPHRLLKNDLIAVVDFDQNFNGFYAVEGVLNPTQIVVAGVLNTTENKIFGLGTCIKLQPRRYEQPADAYLSTPAGGEWSDRKIWADYGTGNQWVVYGVSPVFRQKSANTGSSGYAVSVAYTSTLGEVVADGSGSIYRYPPTGANETVAGGVGSGTKLVAFGDWVYCSSPSEGLVYVYTLNPSTGNLGLVETVNPTAYIGSLTGAIAVGKDRQWLWIANSSTQQIALYKLNNSVIPAVYQYAATVTDPAVPASSGWGSSIATSVDGLKLVVGAPNETVSSLVDAGAAYTYTRGLQRWYADGSTSVFTLGWTAPGNIANVYLNDVLQTTGFTVVGATLTFTSAPASGTIVTASTAYIQPIQRFQGQVPDASALFGNSVDTNRYGSDVVVGSPYEINNVDNVTGVEGAVYRYTNSGQRYGVVTGTLKLPVGITSIVRSANTVSVVTTQPHGLVTGEPVEITGVTGGSPAFNSVVLAGVTVTSPTSFTYSQFGSNESGLVTPAGSAIPYYSGTMYVDGYQVNFSGGISTLVSDINTQTPTNIEASSSGTVLTITVKQDTAETAYNIIDVTGAQATLAALGIAPYTFTQVLYNTNNLSNVSAYGYSVKMDEQDSLLVSAPLSARYSPTIFDYTPNCKHDDTVFDRGTTTFVDSFQNIGTVFQYSYLPAHDESTSNPGKYSFGQYISTGLISASTPQPKFGTALEYQDDTILAGTSGWSTTGGGYAKYTVDWTPEYECEVVKPTTWYIDKQPLPIVDIFALNSTSIYDSTTNQTLEYLDYIDPGLGKNLGAVDQNIDFISPVDPASYEQTGVQWTLDHIGQMWLDTNTVRLLNYHQPSIVYNAKNWGKTFPGSTADVYVWIESIEPPLNYTGIGIPYSYDLYTSSTELDRATNSLVTRYYFWVKNYDLIPPGKTLSPNVLSYYVLNPQNSGIAYLAPVTTNTVALINTAPFVRTNTSLLHLGYGIPGSLDDMHVSWKLVREGDRYGFLTGLPSVTTQDPWGLYLKFIESFCGYDTAGNEVPNPALPPLVRYGTSFRPRQSMFIDRLTALNLYLTRANNIMILYPIVEIKDLAWLEKFSDTYDVRRYWQYVNWWAEGYSNKTKPVAEVANVSDLQTLVENQFIYINGVQVYLQNGLVVKVKASGPTPAQYFVYNSASGVWTRIGLENGTIQFLPAIWDSSNGWSSASAGWGGTWDTTPYTEIFWIIRWLNEQCYTDDLSLERNNSLVLMFKYIQSESQQDQNYLPWLNKTSLVDVNHKIRDLLPYKKYQRDNQEFLEGFLNEVKPYHVYIKDFIFSYEGLDTYNGTVTDFDLPGVYNSTTGYFESPKLVYTTPTAGDEYLPTADIWSSPNYSQWFANRGVGISGGETETYYISELLEPLSATASVLYVTNAASFPVNGYIVIGSEELSYNSRDLVAGTLIGLGRGVNGTTASAHGAGDKIYIQLPGVPVFDTGRGYLNPPVASAYIDTGVWPEPLSAAVLVSATAGDQVISISVVDQGNGYAITPAIELSQSSVYVSFTSGDVNTFTNTITVVSHGLTSGDSVLFTTAGTAPAGLVNGTFYYVRAVDPNIIALYETYSAAVEIPSNPYAHDYILETTLPVPVTTVAGDGRVLLNSAGSGILSVSARAKAVVSSRPVREIKTTIKFDRITFNYTPDWVSGSYYSGLLPVVPDPSPSPDIAFTIVSVDLSGLTPFIEFAPYTTSIHPGQLNGQKLKFVDSTATIVRYYWVKVVTDTIVELWGDPWFTLEVDTGSFPFIAADTAHLGWPVDLNTDYVTYGGKLWRCTTANNDAVFNPANWAEAEPSAADRINRWYSPTVYMPGKALPQLMTGVTYPNAVFQGQEFADGWDYGTWSTLYWDFINSTLDTILVSPDFVYSTPTSYDVDGGAFLDGYTPEELAGCYVSDTAVITITSDDISPTWNHSIEVDKFGGFTVYNDSGTMLDGIFYNRWWYGTIGLDPTTDPLANTTLSVNTNPAAVFLRS